MKKIMIIVLLGLSAALSACSLQEDVKCGAGTIYEDGQCVAPKTSCEDGFTLENGRCIEDEVLTCDAGYVEQNGSCVEETDTCEVGYHDENGSCVPDELTCNPGYHVEGNQCVIDVLDVPDWFTGWYLLTEPSGNLSLNTYEFTETGYSVTVPAGSRTGIQKRNLNFEAGYSYEVRFDYEGSVAGMGLFVQLQAHGGNHLTVPNLITTGQPQSFSQILPVPPTAYDTTGGWFTLEILPTGVTGEMTISNIEIIVEALPTCGENEVLRGLECIPANNGYLPNGTPTAWFTGWEILTVPAGNKQISDLNFTETGYTVYLADGERSGIQNITYEFESGFTYELRFNYTAGVAGRMIWVQMEAFGGYGFTNTETWTVAGTASFSQTLVIPSTYTPVEPGWIKIEVTPGALDNVTIDSIEIIKTAN